MTRIPTRRASGRPAVAVRPNRLAADEPPAPLIAKLQGRAGNSVVNRLVEAAGPGERRNLLSTSSTPIGGAGGIAPALVMRKDKPDVARVEKIKGESVQVANNAEALEAKRLITKFKKTYGVSLSSPLTVTAIKKEYGDVPAKEKAKLKTSTWEMKELRALDAALKHFAPIMGKERKKSTWAKKAQGVTSAGRVEEAIDQNSKQGKVERGTMGEYFRTKKNVGLFNTVTDLEDRRYIREGETEKDNATTLEANSIHEMSHGLIEPMVIGDWIDKMSYWDDKYTPSGDGNAEAPPTQYGGSAASEDLAESVAIFFVNKPSLEATCPERAQFLSDMVAGWTPPVKQAAIKKSKGGK